MTTMLLESSEHWPSLVPRPHSLTRKVSGDYWVTSWLCWLSSIDFEQTLIACLHDVHRTYCIGLHECLVYVALFHWLVQNWSFAWSLHARSLSFHSYILILYITLYCATVWQWMPLVTLSTQNHTHHTHEHTLHPLTRTPHTTHTHMPQHREK